MKLIYRIKFFILNIYKQKKKKKQFEDIYPMF